MFCLKNQSLTGCYQIPSSKHQSVQGMYRGQQDHEILLNLKFWNLRIDYFMEIVMKDTETNANWVKSQTLILFDLMLTELVSICWYNLCPAAGTIMTFRAQTPTVTSVCPDKKKLNLGEDKRSSKTRTDREDNRKKNKERKYQQINWETILNVFSNCLELCCW